MNKCIVCQVVDSKYKCPTCLAFYCSSTCYKSHRELKCAPINNDNPSEEEEAASKFETEDTVSLNKLKLLGESEELKSVLVNPHLQQILKNIDNSPKPDELLQKAMLEPIFVEFADVCLKIVEHK